MPSWISNLWSPASRTLKVYKAAEEDSNAEHVCIATSEFYQLAIDLREGTWRLKYTMAEFAPFSMESSAPRVHFVIPKDHPDNQTALDLNIQWNLAHFIDSAAVLKEEKGIQRTLAPGKVLLSGSAEVSALFTLNSRIYEPLKQVIGPDFSITLKLIFYLPNDDIWVNWRAEIFHSYAEKDLDLEEDALPYIIMDHILLNNAKLEFPTIPKSEYGKSRQPSVFVNGWNSWTYTGTSIKSASNPLGITPTAWSPFLTAANNEALNISKGSPFYSNLYGDMFIAIADPKFPSKWCIINGFLSQKQHFGVLSVKKSPEKENSLQVLYNLPCDKTWLFSKSVMITDPACVQFQLTSSSLGLLSPFKSYFDKVSILNAARQRKSLRIPIGWCTWYYFYEKISEKAFIENIDVLDLIQEELPLSIVQLDDGYQKNVGDWTENDKFPSGLRKLVEHIKQRNSARAQKMVPGVWIAPFIAKPNSDFARKNPQLILKSQKNPSSSADCGVIWASKPVGLDITNPQFQVEVKALLKKCVEEWGFEYLKLDFLYASSVDGVRHDKTKTRAQACVLGLELIRETVGDNIFLVGCGCPIGPAIGYVDAMRVSADVAPNFFPELLGPLTYGIRNDPHFPSAKNAIRNILTRMEMHRSLWLNDPDCLLVRDKDTKLTLSEVRSLASIIGMSGGLFLLSDNLSQLSEERLKIAQSLIPSLPTSARVCDLFQADIPHLLLSLPEGCESFSKWALFSKSNWNNTAEICVFQHIDIAILSLLNELDCDPGDTSLQFHVFEFWNMWYFELKFDLKDRQVYVNKRIQLGNVDIQDSLRIPSHDTRLFAIRLKTECISEISYLGSDLHFSCGKEIEYWKINQVENSLEFSINVGRKKLKSAFYIYFGSFCRYVRLESVREVGDEAKAATGTLTLKVEGITEVVVDVGLKGTIVKLSWRDC